VPESSIARESDIALPIFAGAEIGVASTKAFTCQLTACPPRAEGRGRARRMTPARRPTGCRSPARRARHPQPGAGPLEDEIAAVAREMAEARDVLFLGRGQCIRWRWKAR
jgi:glucosamine--fructose-6-phosphate aminotransferase (isomerizing)